MITAMVGENPFNLEDLQPSDYETQWELAQQTLKIYCEERDYRIEMVAFYDEGWEHGPFQGAHALPNEQRRPFILPAANGGVEWANISLLSIESPTHPGLMCPLVRACECGMRPCEGHFDELWENMDLDELMFFNWKTIQDGEAKLGRGLMKLPPVFAIYWGLEDDDADESSEFHFAPQMD